ncbi:hypothetical protein [Thiomicrorhabdus sp. Kp2]|uniref:hypothetical protein n=1 Tax=Thiomicrorhabdus sp. Kp2 TaxID=1123518 RepID=UPI00041E40A1|nr:hypothetical protein [Thiomicrorhabdus sp. Kp2]
MRLIPLFATALVTASIALTGCNSTETKTAETKPAEVKSAAMASSITLFEAHHEGRINQFYDQKTFDSYMSVGETAYRLTRIGSGPNGETVVFGLPKADKKKGAETPAAMLWDGKYEVTSFYGEMYKHGRIYVFNEKADMDFVRKIGEPSYMYTEIGAGPKGETVVFVLNKNNKKKKPVELMAQFKSMH